MPGSARGPGAGPQQARRESPAPRPPPPLPSAPTRHRAGATPASTGNEGPCGVPALPAAPPAPSGGSASSAAPRPGGERKRTLRGGDRDRAGWSGPPLPPTCSRGLRTSADTTAILTVSSSRRRMTDNTAGLRRRIRVPPPAGADQWQSAARACPAPSPPGGPAALPGSALTHFTSACQRLLVCGRRAEGALLGGAAGSAGTRRQPQG